MIRTLILGGALALGLGAAAQADGFAPGREPGYGAPRLHRSVHLPVRHRRVVRYAHRRYAVAPGGLTQSLNVPLYNVPPRRFP